MRRITVISMLFLLFASACTKSQAVYDKQETVIDNLVQAILKTDEDAKVEYLDGVVRLTLSSSTSVESDPALESGGTVKFYYGGYTLNSASISPSSLFATNLKELAEASGWGKVDESMFAEETVTIGGGELVKGLETGLVGVRKGDECYILFSGKYGWGKHAKGTVPARSATAWHIWVTDVSN